MTQAADDYAVIRARIAELAETARPRCAIINRPFYVFDCLRSPLPCPPSCPIRADWLGPQPA